MGMHLIASNATIKAIRANDERTCLSDGKGLYLRLFVRGGSHAWWFDYTFEGRRKTKPVPSIRPADLLEWGGAEHETGAKRAHWARVRHPEEGVPNL